MAKNVIRVYFDGIPLSHPWKVKVNEKADPCNREFRDFKDIRKTYENLMKNGFYDGYTLVFPKGRNNRYD